MAQEEFPVAYFFQSDNDINDRKKVCDQYAKKFETQLFKLNETQRVPKIDYLGRSEDEFKHADGLFIGEKIIR